MTRHLLTRHVLMRYAPSAGQDTPALRPMISHLAEFLMHRMRSRVRTRAWRLGAAATVVALAGCGADSNLIATGPRLAPSQAVGVVVASPRNVLLAVGGSADLSATAYDLTGNSLGTPDSVTYRYNSTADSLRLTVTRKNATTFTLTGRSFAFDPVLVNIFVYKNNTVNADQAFVWIVDAPLTGPLSLSIQSTEPDSLRDTRQAQLFAQVTNTNGDIIDNLKLRYAARAGDSLKIATYSPDIQSPEDETLWLSRAWPYFFGELNSINALTGADSAYVTTELNAFGTPLYDTIGVRLVYPSTGTFGPFSQLSGYEIIDLSGRTKRIFRAPAVLTFTNNVSANTQDAPLPIDYIFDQPDKALAATPGGDTGNIIGLPSYESTKRLFTTPGTYRYTATVRGNIPPYSGQSWTLTFTIK